MSPTPPPEVVRAEPLARHTSLKVGGPADYFAPGRTPEQIAGMIRWALEAGLPARVIGGGSNLLVADGGVDGLVIKAAATVSDVVERDGGPVLVADAGATIANVARRLSKQGYGGLEWATNVPGTVGGACVNNAGAFGGDTASHLVAATIVDAAGSLRRLAPGDLQYGYRTSRLKRRELGDVAVVQVELRVVRADAAESVALVQRFQEQRTRSQPRQLSAGSVFANPEGTYSGLLIEQAGLKGARVGGAQLSPQHANFIVNAGGARAADVHALMRLAQTRVYERERIWLTPEIELFGRWSAEERNVLLSPL